ncbi:Mediator complex, subunit Med22 [Kalmanozyma brasiliensis GHG001]|uniref:Mediator complex, subunit Med22 n=1 Tax=Kalmanozyma brasiliensis (strain GHG001) TaxID=1365824 RepID=UPI0028680B44|nr:Mediator complex, subunit Med22 [Kalmanozyma brasiliensis GHG001]EST09156.2 Mediator complex, subunit Med22 [Kalmanozyma brasiliensis GHG001]
MVKSDDDVIKEFGELVNMSATELEKWLKGKDSTSSGWTNGEGGETVGHQSGTKIVDILKRNPDKKKDKYTDDDIKHMRKVVSYNKRHLAQEEHLKQKKSKEELQKTKSYKSLKTGQPDASSSSSASSSNFRSDVALPTALNLGKIGTSATTASTAAAASTSNSRLSNSAEYLDSLEEGVNKTIDAEVETLLSSYKELVSLASIADKDKYRVAQEAFQTEARADIMVRSTQTLSLLSEALKLSLLLSKSLDPALNDEAVELIKSTEAEKLRCALLLGEIMGLDVGKAEDLVNDMDRTFIKTHTATEDLEDDEMEDVSAG